MKNFTLVLLLALNLLSIGSFAQDTLVAKDGTVLFGEIKEMDHGTITMETSFSDDDFTITWLEVQQIISSRSFRFTLADGKRLYGTISKDTTANKLVIVDKKKALLQLNLIN